MRYQFYREHKYVSAALNDLERQIAKANFADPKETDDVAKIFQPLAEMLRLHAKYENEKIHSLLKNKNSHIQQIAEEDHAQQEIRLLEIQELINQIKKAKEEENKIAIGYQLYLTYRKFVGDNLLHLHEEETVILPELQRLYTDEELKQIEASTYHIMTKEQMVHMLEVLFPHINPSDRKAFLSEIYEVEPEKFKEAWKKISFLLEEKERAYFE